MCLFTSDSQNQTKYDSIYEHLVSLEDSIGLVPQEAIDDRIAARQRVCQLWEKYSHLLDNKSKNEIKTHFYSVYWELYLCDYLHSSSFNFNCRKSKGPDFHCSYPQNDKSFYFEAISVKPGEGQNQAEIADTHTPNFKERILTTSRYDSSKLKLRLTQGIQEKANKFKDYLKDQSVLNNDLLIIAIHYRDDSGFFTGNSGLSVFHESVFPLGPQTIRFNVDTGQAVDSFISHQPCIHKVNGTPIDTSFFLSQDSSIISGLFFSNTSYTNLEDPNDKKVGFIHNPMASNKLPTGLFKNASYGEWEMIADTSTEHCELKQVDSH